MFNRLEGELEAREKSLGLRMADLFTLPDALVRLLSWMLRQKQVRLAEIAEVLGNEAAAKQLLDEALNKGYVREFEMRGSTFYRVRIAPKPAREQMSNLWEALYTKVENEEGPQ